VLIFAVSLSGLFHFSARRTFEENELQCSQREGFPKRICLGEPDKILAK